MEQCTAWSVTPSTLLDRRLSCGPRTDHGQVIPLGPQRGAGYMTAPFVGDITLPEFGVKKAKAEKLFADQFYADRFKGSVKVGMNAA